MQIPDIPDEVELEILRAIDESGMPLEQAIEAVVANHPELRDAIRDYVKTNVASRHDAPTPHPERIGPYRIRAVLGRGGMGVVYLAEKAGEVSIRVALKVVKLGMDSNEVLRRFEREGQALAMMEHDSIARFLDAGITDSGQPYFAMEYVKGVSITRFCNEGRLGIDERLSLFRQVCSAIQHAHHKGVIHRDITPGNVLVSIRSGEPQVKVIDFGLARATNPDAERGTLISEHGKLFGTPGYMSPEQAGLDGLDIDSRTDVYSLGVLLYELLTGRRPFDFASVDTPAGREAFQKAIREELPQRPSTRVAGLTREEVTTHVPGADPGDLRRRLRGDLDWITMRALEKNRLRRYATVDALADDVARHQNDEPVQAGPPGAGYRVRKLVTKYRGQTIAAAFVLMAFVLGAVVHAVQSEIRANESDERASEGQQRISELQKQIAQLERRSRDLNRNVERLTREGERGEQTIAEHQEAIGKLEPQLHSTRVELQNARDSQREIAESCAKAMTDLEHAKQRTECLRQLDVNTQLSQAIERAREFLSAPPDREAVLQRWLDQASESLAAKLEPTERAAAWFGESVGADVSKSRGSVEFRRYEVQRRVVESLERADRVRRGEESIPLIVDATLSAESLDYDEIRQFVHPDRDRHAYGREREFLFKARAAVRVTHRYGQATKSQFVRLRAWAELATGLVQDARESMREAAALGGGMAVAENQRAVFELERVVARSATLLERERQMLFRLETDAAVLSIESEFDRTTFRGLRSAVEGMRDVFSPQGLVSQVRRLFVRVREERSALGKWSKRWAEARESILDSRRYRLEIPPQQGLVPLWENEKTGLWEFYHPGSAAAPATIPDSPEAAEFGAEPNSGIVFVLVPDRAAVLGAHRIDKAWGQYDPDAERDEAPFRARLSLYFIAKYELTQGQWLRLSGGERPSSHMQRREGSIDLATPVETVGWNDCDDLLRFYGLMIPTESQWEYACRGGTATPWNVGNAGALDGAANLRSGLHLVAGGKLEVTLRDSFRHTARVGRFRPNAFGLYDMHGNVAEWCRDTYSFLDLEHSEALRVVAGHAHRGGSFESEAVDARCAARAHASSRSPTIGVRPARRVEWQ